MYNAISEKIQELPITENNFELIIYGLEYQYLHLKFRTLERKMLLISLVMLLVQVMASLVLQTWWNQYNS